ncbi:MAG: complex I subunit 1 family protein [Sulfolobales archaeon]|nr:NADH-quinone oxidoreductase subunit H [Sulfolobales archaeon]MCX8186438.1 NADH-quinone oxidoreductase subunit H [Sulfolobales archaeon]MDW7969768.1 complex I subunit 1 family protein [Sulfolobales archaeon]
MTSFNVLLAVLSALIYPGLFFLVVVGLLTQWYIRKLVGRLQNRIGPKYVGPLGILQPFADVVKLIFVKEEVSFRGRLDKFLAIFMALGLGALSAAMLFTPISPYVVRSPYDVVVFIYLMLWSTIAFAVIGLSLSNPFTVAGSSRFLTQILFAEPALATSLLATVIVLTKSTSTPLSIYSSLTGGRFNIVAAVVITLSLISFFIASIAKTLIKPFDIPEAETELAGGLLAELSGPALGLATILHYAEVAFLTLITTMVFLGGPYPFSYGELLGALVFALKYLAVLTLIAVIKASVGRIRIEQSASILIKYVFSLSVVALLIASFF